MQRHLTDTRIKNAKSKPIAYKIFDGGGLYVFVSTTGAKSWRYKYRIAGKEYVYSIGPYPEIMLKEARVRHGGARELVAQGTHPLHMKKLDALKKSSDATNTFASIAKDWIAKREAGWSDSYRSQVKTVMDNDVLLDIGPLPIKQVTPAHLLKIIKRVESRGAETLAGNIRMWCSAIFDSAVASLQAESNPAAALKGAIVRPKVKHNKRLSAKELPAFYKKLQDFKGLRTTAIALELMLLTFVRTKELCHAEWTEFDLDAAVWHIPAERMKMKAKHIVPLAPRAVELLRELKKLTGEDKFLFRNRRRSKACMSATTINAALVRMKYGGRLSAHGFRGTASTQLHELGFRTEVIERQLAHAERNKVKAAYNAAEYLVDRRMMMEAWADFARRIDKDNVVALKHVA